MESAREMPAAGFVTLPHGEGLDLPAYQTPQSAGMDLCAALSEPLVLKPGERALIPTGLAIELPSGHEGQVRPRSGLALKHAVTVLNAPGTIDQDYRGELKVLLINLGDADFIIERGMRIAQLVVAPYVQVAVESRTAMADSSRGTGGFGSTGV